MLHLGWKLRADDHRLLKAIEPAAVRNQQCHRRFGDLIVLVANQGRKEHALPWRLARLRGSKDAMLFDAAKQQRDQLGVAQSFRRSEDRQRQLDPDAGQRRMQRRMTRLVEGDRERRAQFVLDRAHQPGEQRRHRRPMLFTQAERFRQEQIGEGHGNAFARGCV
jgi:hypothetical protein